MWFEAFAQTDDLFGDLRNKSNGKWDDFSAWRLFGFQSMICSCYFACCLLVHLLFGHAWENRCVLLNLCFFAENKWLREKRNPGFVLEQRVA